MHDALVLSLLAGRAPYGRSRAFGSVAWGVAALALGALVDRFGYGAIFVVSCVAPRVLPFLFIYWGGAPSRVLSFLILR